MDVLLHYSKYITIFTGAGVSTGVGIPDFRGKGTSSETRPDFSKFNPGLEHRLIAEMVNTGKVKFLITQNIDDLHRDVSEDKIIELHGNMMKNKCDVCNLETRASECCGKPSCPSLVDFGVDLDIHKYDKAVEVLQKTDLLVIFGTSLKVAPSNRLPSIVLKNGGNVVLVNKDPTSLDDRVRLLYHCDVKDILIDMRNIWENNPPSVQPTKLKGMLRWNNTIPAWTCTHCTFSNILLSDECEMCHTLKYSEVPPDPCVG